MKKLLKNILITAGGTIVKVDDVRHIGNFSSGKFPSQLAEQALLKGCRVFYLHAKSARKPFDDDFIFNPQKPGRFQFIRIIKSQKRFLALAKNLRLYQFETFDDYRNALKKILRENPIGIVFLAAAVSDFGVKPARGKISSAGGALKLTLFKHPKIIKSVKSWSKKPVFQAGFKLLSRSSEKNLQETAYRSGLENKSDITVANDLAEIRSGRRAVVLATPEKGFVKMTEPRLAEKVFSFTERRADVAHFKTLARSDAAFADKYRKEGKIFRRLCRRLYGEGLMVPYYKGSPAAHGSLALRTEGDDFLITGRSSDKRNLKPEDVLLVTGVDWKKRTVATESPDGGKPSFNAVLCAAIFRRFPEIRAVVHTHNLIPGLPATSFPETPGTLEYIQEPVKLLRRNRIINLCHHGALAVGRDLTETVNYVIKKSQK